MNSELNRRELLKAGAIAGALGLTLGSSGLMRRALAQPVTPPAPAKAGRARSIRLVHMTDTHIQPELDAFKGVEQCLGHIQSMSDRPSLILTGGDLVFDSFDQKAERTGMLWDLWSKTLKDHCSLPIEHCIGNHDIWGWNKKKSGTKGDEGKWGKRWVMDVLGLEKPYRTFDRAGWRFVVLDSVFPDGEGYTGRLDEEQFAWLEGVLKGTPREMNVLVLSHIPILTVTAMGAPKDAAVKKHETAFSLMMSDMPRIVGLFKKHPNVRACLSGHIHQVDRVEYQGVTYLCDGAVSGGWWKGKHKECGEGYAVLDLFDDGRVERSYEGYGWAAVQP